MPSVGFTTSVPIEVLLAAGRRPVDLNNVFISRPDAAALVQGAERNGFPAACCAWVKGIYAVVAALELEEVIGVVRGDCSQTQALLEVLQLEGVPVYPFAYPYDRSPVAMREEIRKLRRHFGAREKDVVEVKRDLDRIRGKLRLLDRLTWRENLVSGEENLLFLVSSSDMGGDPRSFERGLDAFLAQVETRGPLEEGRVIRLGIIGVPPIWKELCGAVERQGVRVVYHEVPRQFSMPATGADLAAQYLLFTYPYDVFYRIRDIEREVRRRHLDGLIHYVQAFCFRQIEDKVLRSRLRVPILTLEGDRPETLDARTRVRLEAFTEMLSRNGDPRGESGPGN